MPRSFLLPDLGEGIHEAEILAIPVTIGQQITEGNPLLEVETDKAAVEIPSPFTGTIIEILAAVGDMVQVGTPLFTFSEVDSQQSSRPTAPLTNTPGAKRPPVPASPSTRKLARERGVDLYLVPPTGRGGIVTREDVEKYASLPKDTPSRTGKDKASDQTVEAPQVQNAIGDRAEQPSAAPFTPTSLPDFSKWGEIERLPFRSIRRATARQMTASWSQIPHVHCEDTINITPLEKFRQRHKKEIEAAGGQLTMTVFAMKAVATALKTYPLFNSSLDTEAQEIIVKRYFNIGIAVDSPGGLMVPVIRNVDRKSIKELAIELKESIDKVRNGKPQREDLSGGTFTITNAGALGGHRFTAIVNHPEVAILGLGAARMQPTVVTDEKGEMQIIPQLMMPIVLCFDHRVVDGGDAIRFLRLIIDALNDPDELLITMI